MIGEIEATVAIFPREGSWWLLISSDLFGPYESDEQAIDAIPDALRSTF